MKRYILTLLLAACVCTACDKDDEYAIREWTVASQLGIAHGASTLQPVLLVKANDDTSWRALYGGIEGFEYQPGYEYRLRIKAEQLPDTPQDGSSIRYTLLEQISKAPATSVIPERFFPAFTMEVAPQPMNYRGQRFLGVRFPESGLNEWQPWPFRIEGFEYEPTRCSTWTGSPQRTKRKGNRTKNADDSEHTNDPSGSFFHAGNRSSLVSPLQPRCHPLRRRLFPFGIFRRRHPFFQSGERKDMPRHTDGDGKQGRLRPPPGGKQRENAVKHRPPHERQGNDLGTERYGAIFAEVPYILAETGVCEQPTVKPGR